MEQPTRVLDLCLANNVLIGLRNYDDGVGLLTGSYAVCFGVRLARISHEARRETAQMPVAARRATGVHRRQVGGPVEDGRPSSTQQTQVVAPSQQSSGEKSGLAVTERRRAPAA